MGAGALPRVACSYIARWGFSLGVRIALGRGRCREGTVVGWVAGWTNASAVTQVDSGRLLITKCAFLFEYPGHRPVKLLT